MAELPMRLQFWLAQAAVSRRLHFILRIAVAALLVWSAAAGAGLWTVRTALTREQGRLAARRGEWRAMDAVARRRENEAPRQASNGADAPPTGSADFVDAMSRLARRADTQMVSAHLEAPTAAPQTITQTAAQPSASVALAGSAPGAAFECRVAGPFPSVARFLDLLARQPAPLQIGSLEASCLNALPGTPHPPLQLKLTGTVAD
ncbi:MAG: hypothetical protein M3154_04960, partial [Candidatus Eremiobacteraeota bacterium]|nr:hypothetical protein [Candidatus Eremiobacteraeota bacterium]